MQFPFPTWESIPPEYRTEPLHQKQYLLGGKLLEWEGATDAVYSPISVGEGENAKPYLLGSIPSFSVEEALKALDSAETAYQSGIWSRLRVDIRIRAVQEFTLLMKERREQIVRLLMWEIGKTKGDSEKEFDRTIEYIDDTINALKDQDRHASRFVFEKGILAQIKRSPMGVVLCMGPFNYPLNETFCTLIPAIIMGNTVIFKPARYGVLLLQPLLECFQKAFPPGVINTIYGDGSRLIGPIMETGKVQVLAFIGSSKTVNLISKKHPKPNRLRKVLGLNAKNPAIVLRDANLLESIPEIVSGNLSFNGQRCTALKITFVPENLVSSFLDLYLKELENWKAGMPWEAGVRLTPLPETGKTQWLKELVEDALAKGAKILNPGGGEVFQNYMHPAVLYPVIPEMRIYEEEQFGPIVPIVSYKDISEVIRYMEESSLGQQASIFGRDPHQIGSLVDQIVNQVSRININAMCQRGPDTFPFTGRKDSAEGTLSVIDALRSFSIRTLVATKDSEPQKELIREILFQRTSQFLNTDFIL